MKRPLPFSPNNVVNCAARTPRLWLFCLLWLGLPSLTHAQLIQQWLNRYDSNISTSAFRNYAMVRDAANNVYVTSRTSDNNYLSIKYNNTGVQQWAVTADNAGKVDEPGAIAVDASGNVYVTGNSDGGIFTIKYSAAGIQQWAVVETAAGAYTNVVSTKVNGIAVDASGNVYVAGHRGVDPGADEDLVTIKYNASGTRQWLVSRVGSGNYDGKEAVAIGLDGSGNVYVAGNSPDALGSVDYEVVKYNPSGVQQWVVNYGSTGVGDFMSDMVLDASGNVYVTGSSPGTTTGQDYVTVKYSTSGALQWVSRYSAAGSWSDYPRDIALDASANVYVTGWSEAGTPLNQDYATVKYNASGAQQWVARYNGPSNGSAQEYANAVAVDSYGYVYVAGNAGTLKYDPSGGSAGYANHGGIGRDIAVDGQGNAFVLGSVPDGAGSTTYDFATVKYVAGTITTGTLSTASYCVGSAVTIPYAATGAFYPGNVFKAELSNASGSFAVPTALVTVSATSTSITARIPNNAAAGTAYRVRIISSSPKVTGTDNGANLTIRVPPAVTLTSDIDPDYAGGPISVCPGTPIAFTASSTATGSVTYAWSTSDATLLSSASGSTTTFTATTPGTYYVTLKASDGMCTRSVSRQVDVLDGCGGRRAILRIGENPGSQVLLYPNPARDHFVVRTAAAAQGATVQLVDMQGRVRSTFTVTDREQHVATADLPAGLYVVKVMQGAGSIHKKIRIAR